MPNREEGSDSKDGAGVAEQDASRSRPAPAMPPVDVQPEALSVGDDGGGLDVGDDGVAMEPFGEKDVDEDLGRGGSRSVASRA